MKNCPRPLSPYNAAYALSGGALDAGWEILGWGGADSASLTQTGGTNHAGRLSLGWYGGTGTYDLRAGTLRVDGDENLTMVAGNAPFTQSGGAHAVGGNVNLGSNEGTHARIVLSAGAFTAGGGMWVGGWGGEGFYTQTGGDASLAWMSVNTPTSAGAAVALSGGSLTVRGGMDVNAAVRQDGGAFSAAYERVGFSVPSSVTVNAGTHAIAGELKLGSGEAGTFDQTGGVVSAHDLSLAAGSPGTYNLSGGQLQTVNEALSFWGGAATFNQTGGAHAVAGSLYIKVDTGSAVYNLSGGTLTIGGGLTNNGAFNYAGGELHADVINNGTFNVSGGGTRTVDGNFVNNGTLKTYDTAFAYTGTFTNNGVYSSDPADNYFADLLVGPRGSLKGGAGDRFFVKGALTTPEDAYLAGRTYALAGGGLLEPIDFSGTAHAPPLSLSVVAVPEPGATGLAVAAGAGAFFRRPRRRAC